MSEEFSAPPCPDEEPETPRWQKRPPMPAVKPRRNPRQQLLSMAQLIDAAKQELDQIQRKGISR